MTIAHVDDREVVEMEKDSGQEKKKEGRRSTTTSIATTTEATSTSLSSVNAIGTEEKEGGRGKGGDDNDEERGHKDDDDDEEEEKIKKKMNCLHHFMHHWPRLTALLTRTIFLYCLLIVILIFGFILSKMESPTEIQNNDLFLRQTWLLKSLPISQTTQALVSLPTTCLLEYQKLVSNQQNNVSTSNTAYHDVLNGELGDANSLNDINTHSPYTFEYRYINDTDMNVTWASLLLFANSTLFTNDDAIQNLLPNKNDNNTYDFYLPTLPPNDNNETPASSFTNDDDEEDESSFEDSVSTELFHYMLSCEQLATDLLSLVMNFTLGVVAHDFKAMVHDDLGSAGLTFNWIRCYNNADIGRSNPFRPSQRQIEASIYSNQIIYYTTKWNNDRIELYNNYITEYDCQNNNGTGDGDDDNVIDEQITKRTKCYLEATVQSVLNASGKDGCGTNTGSSAWFWFTIMTTVGYGNFAPNTRGGKWFVTCFGWLAIIAFGGIMVLNGNTYTAIAHDLFARFNIKWMQRPVCSASLYGIISIIWITFEAFRTRQFWDNRAPDFEYSVGDSYWFSYITLLTVGLGDFVLQPQVMFISDVITWTLSLLHGFVFVTSFLGKFGELLQQYFPSRGESFESRLANSHLWGFGVQPPVSKSLEILKKLVDIEEEHQDTAIESTATTSADNNNNVSNRDNENHIHHNYRSSFYGNENAKGPDGNTINSYRIGTLIEKKNLLIKLLDDAQSELEDRVRSKTSVPNDGSLRQNSNNNVNNSNDIIDGNKSDDNSWHGIIDPLALHHVPVNHVSRRFLLERTVGDLQYEEQVLESTLLRTKDVRTRLEEYQMNDYD